MVSAKIVLSATLVNIQLNTCANAKDRFWHTELLGFIKFA
ncbi:hypothetical protein PSECIP111951_03137 [Pseudoalteromonas holothuriae]|uniref:Uncharacterized protein n=1 Tax=Pseudoalteromonas holothuriae TaxID=2963714 RepID=A0A9W4QUL9_9GAMM|nr:hypothetical protein PSECIP111854_01276 [Pseudoalteromonas sp. CIP111854]CAH9064464.1 hypothetical protein PSECIP111951_03137 [Pseudoalteromonas sp. CIP111951]